jgi:uncharacterized membrane protein
VAPESELERIAFRWCVIALLAVSALYLVETYVTAGAVGVGQIASSAAFSLFFIGKFVIFAGLKQGQLPVWSLALLVFLMDMGFAFALASGIRGLERTQWIGEWLRRARGRALEVLAAYPGLKRMAFFGVVAFVLLPVAGTGAITGSFVARVLGLSRLSGIAAIAVASAWTTLSFAFLATFIGERAELLLRNPLLVGVSIAGFLVVGWVLYQHLLRKLRT